jgi:hypothetical protein
VQNGWEEERFGDLKFIEERHFEMIFIVPLTPPVAFRPE